jgi:hypothetical protein
MSRTCRRRRRRMRTCRRRRRRQKKRKRRSYELFLLDCCNQWMNMMLEYMSIVV